MSESCEVALVKQYGKDVPTEILRKVIADVGDFKAGSAGQKSFIEYLRDKSPETISFLKKERFERLKINNDFAKRMLKGESPHRIIEETLVGSTRTADGSKDSISVNRDARYQSHKTYLNSALDPETEVHLRDSAFTKDVIVEVYNINKGIESNSSFTKAAKLIINMNEYVVSSLERAGIPIKNRADYIIRQTHDPGKMAKDGYQKWSSKILERLDHELTFGSEMDPTARAKMLKGMYDDLTVNSFSGQGHSSLGKARSIHFKDGASFADYHLEYGEGSILEVMDRTLKSAAKAEAIRRKLGPRPLEALEFIETVGRKYIEKTKGKEAADAFSDRNITGQGASRDRWKKQIFGYEHVGRSLLSDVLVDGLKGAQTISAAAKLGFAGTTTLSDMTTSTAALMSKTGMGFVKSQTTLIKNYFALIKDPVLRQKVGTILGLDFDHDSFRFIDQGVDATSGFTRFTNGVMKLTFLDKLTKQNRKTMAISLSNHISDADPDFSKVDIRLKNELAAFGIKTEDQWMDIKSSTETYNNTLNFINPEKIISSDTAIRFQNFMWHNTKFGAISPGDATKSLARMGVSPDSVMGQTLNALLQFKNFPMEATRTLKELAGQNPKADNSSFMKSVFKNADNAKIMGIMATHGFFTALTGIWIRDILAGKEPRPMNAPTAFDAMAKGVYPLWAGYFNDMAKGSYGSMKRNILQEAAGPIFGQIQDVVELGSTIMEDSSGKRRKAKAGKVGSQALRLVRQNTPLINFPIIKPILDHYFLDELSESLNPGYKARRVRRMRKQGQEFLPIFK